MAVLKLNATKCLLLEVTIVERTICFAVQTRSKRRIGFCIDNAKKKINYPFDWMVLKHKSQVMLIHMGTQ